MGQHLARVLDERASSLYSVRVRRTSSPRDGDAPRARGRRAGRRSRRRARPRRRRAPRGAARRACAPAARPCRRAWSGSRRRPASSASILSLSWPRAESTMMGVVAPLAQAARDLDAVEVGQAQVEQDEVGRAGGRLARGPAAPVVGLDQAVAVGAAAWRAGSACTCGSSSTTSTQRTSRVRRSGSARHRRSPSSSIAGGVPTSGSVKRKARAARVAVLGADPAAVRGHDRPADGEAQAEAAVVAPPAR